MDNVYSFTASAVAQTVNTATSTRRQRRLLETYEVYFVVVESLSLLGYSTAGEFESALNTDLQTAIYNGQLTADFQTECGYCGMQALSVAVAPKREYPTLLPTPVPTPVPSLVPTSEPTPVPTIYCAPGEYLDNATGFVCIPCGIGAYSDATRPPWPSSCKQCPSGRYNSYQGAAVCPQCPQGKLSTEDRSVCIGRAESSLHLFFC